MKIDFTDIQPKKILDSGFLEDYNKSVEAIWWQLVSLSSKVLVLEKIIAFRFDLFDDNYPSIHFWNLTINSIYESSILCVWRVSIDNAHGVGMTLNQLKNKIFQNIQDVQVREQFAEELKSIDFDNRVADTNKKITELRHNLISHFNYVKYSSPQANQNMPTINMDELNEIQRKIVEYFNILCFGEMKAVYPIEYDSEVIHSNGYDQRLDIEKILDGIAKASYYIKGDQDNPEVWRMHIDSLSKEDLAVINHYRNKFNKPKI